MSDVDPTSIDSSVPRESIPDGSAREGSPIRRALSQPVFLVICSILLVAAVTLNAATQALRLHFKKEPVPQPNDFHTIPAVMGGWMQVSEDEKLDKETQDVLGTDKYIYRDYVRVSQRGSDLLVYLYHQDHKPADNQTPDAASDAQDDQATSLIRSKFEAASFDQQVKQISDALKDKTPQERKNLTYALQLMKTDGIVNMGLTYYTGLVDTVAHIPDRCYIADGYEPSSYDQPIWNLGSAGNPVPIKVRFISFDDQTGGNRASKCVAYVFHANGNYDSDPLGVRRTLQSLTQRFGYYAKIELMTVSQQRDNDVAGQNMRDFLAAARPEIEKCFPDWKKVTEAHP